MRELLAARRGPFADSYAAAVILVVCALVPFLALAAAVTPLEAEISRGVGLSKGALQLTVAMSDAAYAFGTVLAVQFAQHVPQRRMLLLYVTVFFVSALVALWAPTAGLFVAAFVLEGLCTSLMLIAAVPPLVVGWGAGKMRVTGAIMNLCVFGAVAAGPAIGGFEAGARDWRVLFAVVAALAGLALVFTLVTYEDAEPQNRNAPWDVGAIALAGFGCAAAFFGAAELDIHRKATALGMTSLGVGLVAIVLLVVHEYAVPRPLMPVKMLATTFPVFGLVIAISASAAAFGLMDLTLTALEQRSPTHTALLFLPELGAAVLTAALFGLSFRTRFIPVYALAGIGVVACAGVVLSGAPHAGDARIAVGAALLGLGVGAAVSPGLFIAGFSLASNDLQRVFAVIELLRGVGALLFAPVLLFLVGVLSSRKAVGIADAAWICVGLALGAAAIAVTVFAAGRGRLQVPDLDAWEAGDGPAWVSPPLLDAVSCRRDGG